MAGLKDKTPVSSLQEYLVSQKIIPHYELIQNGVGTHNPVFTYRVEARGVSVEGTGRSKREAKHRAAEKLLKSLNIRNYAPTESEDSNDASMEPAENHVGQLKELCLLKCYPEPKYYLEEAAGPPHSRIFRMVCCVSQLQDHGVATTKKQAKQQAAWKMLQHLKEYMVEEPGQNEMKQVPELKKLAINNEEVIEKYNTFRPSSAPTINKDPVVFYKDHHKAYIGLQKTSPTLSDFANNPDQISVDVSLSAVNDIARELEVNLTTTSVPSKEPNNKFVIMTMSLFPPIAGIGDTEQKAALDLLNSLLFLCKG